jgi:hypothetical protein
VAVPTNGDKVVYGASAGYRVYPSQTQGFVFGGGATFTPPEGRGRQLRGWADVQAGYGYQPLPHLGCWGTELTAGLAAGVLPDAGGYPISGGVVWHAGFPYRISGSKKPWELTEHMELFSTLTPSVGLVQLIPFGAGHEHRVVSTAVFSLTYRLSDFVLTQP